MANPVHFAKLKEGVSAWHTWLFKHVDTAADLREAKLRRAKLGGANLCEANAQDADLRDANLSGANLSGANLCGADLSGANLSGADLTDAELDEANLSHSDLSEAVLNYADLSEAVLNDAHLYAANLLLANLSKATLFNANLFMTNFFGANFFETNFSQARLRLTNFAAVNLSTAKELQTVIHEGPSPISIDTFYMSQGKIPEVFLRGCGVPEQFITYARSLVSNPIEFYSCFISYSTKNGAFAQRLHVDLQASGLRVWFAPEDLKIGDRFQERIEESIRLYDKVMIILSRASIQSAWVEREVNAAWERERREKRLVLFPIRIDNAVMTAPAPWAADLRRQRHIGDFSGWKDHDAYQKALTRLLRDLQAETPAPSI
ncbi:MAG TPA: toll/interleukin-1 receptor domain-containing protein [Bryobacteraceae bacterium]|nr:toll/interleukin-1 receptor domain-containing protein [Bryobacteraceae bacterium]